jgi:hypothetical protein
MFDFPLFFPSLLPIFSKASVKELSWTKLISSIKFLQIIYLIFLSLAKIYLAK